MIQQHHAQHTVLAAPKLPPVAGALPLVGALPDLMRRSFAFFVTARERYGDIYTLDLGLQKVIVLNHPRHAQYMLRDNAKNYLRGGALYDTARKILGDGLAMTEGAYWLRQRRMMQPHFHRKQLAGLTDLMVATIDENLHTLAAAVGTGATLSLLPTFSRFTMSVVVRALFGTSLGSTEADALGALMSNTTDHFMQNTLTSTLPSWLPIPGRKRYFQTREQMDVTLRQLIARSRQPDADQATLVAMMLNMVDAETGAQMTDQQLRDEAVTLVFAGYETTSIALSWICDLLMHHPDVMARLQHEVDTVLGGRTPTLADLPALSYTSQVIYESLRLYPPAWFTTRTAVADDTIDGYAIPAGSQVMVLPYTVHRHPEFWPAPERFDPDRFAPERVAMQHKFAMIAFGVGQHRCIGKDFAIMETQLILAMLLQRFRLAPLARSLTAPRLTPTLQPRGGVLANVRPR